MAAPPPDGLSRGQQALPLVASGHDQRSLEPEGPPSEWISGRRRGAAVRTVSAPWLWLPLGLSSMLLVLFLVVVNRQQAQAQRIGELLSRVQDLEQSRALERTAVLEQQLRSMVNRLQQLEKQNKQQEQLVSQVQSLQEELQLLRRSASRPLDLSGEAIAAPEKTLRSERRPSPDPAGP
jgi:TolA-binding protein